MRNDLALMVSGESVEAKVQEYAATSMELTTREENFFLRWSCMDF